MNYVICTLLVVSSMVCATDSIERHIYGIVLAGGSGERLWPLSRQDRPKQFLKLGSDKSLLEQAVDRLYTVANQENVWLVASQKHANYLRAQKQFTIGNLLIEPAGRNTAAAVLYSCLKVYEQDPEAIIIFVPADAFISSHAMTDVKHAFEKAINYVATHDVIGLFGVKPTFPATGYGYIEYEETPHSMHQVKRFHEKPSLALAQEYIKQSTMLWNIGMFAGKAKVFINEFKHHAPGVYEGVVAYMNGSGAYTTIPSISIDYAVIEKSNNVCVLPVEFPWCDVGNVEVFLTIKQQFEGKQNNIVQVDAKNNLINVPNKMVALIGVDDLCIIETEDALLITKRSEAEKVRSVVTTLKEKKQFEYV